MGGRTPTRAMPQLSLADAIFLVENKAELKKTMERWEAKNAEIIANIELQGTASQIPQLHKSAADAKAAAEQQAATIITQAEKTAADTIGGAREIMNEAIAVREQLTQDQAAFKQEQQAHANNNEAAVKSLDARDEKLAELELKAKQDAEAAEKAKAKYEALLKRAKAIEALEA